jgi:site-specific recombinase XerC
MFTDAEIETCDGLMVTWPAHHRQNFKDWLTGKRSLEINVPGSLATVVNYARNITAVFKWAASRDITTCPTTWGRSELQTLRDDMAARGSAPATTRLQLVALDRLIVATDEKADRHQIKALLRTLPRRNPKNRKRGRIPDVTELRDLGLAIMQDVIDSGERKIPAAVTFRVGMMIALLPMRPYRRTVFASFQYLPALVPLPPGSAAMVPERGGYALHVKNPKRPRHVRGKGGKFSPEYRMVPSELFAWLELYINVYRPILLGDRDDDALWITNRGTRLSSHQIYTDVVRVTEERFGLSCAPHMFRDAYATTVHERAPDLASKINIPLGNRPAMTHEHYVAPSPHATIDASKRAGAIFDAVAASQRNSNQG